AINGGLNGLADRRQRYQRALAMGDLLLPRKEPDMTPEQAKMLERIHHELTHRFQSRVDGSEYRDTNIGYVLNTDAAAYRTEVAVAEILDRLDRIEQRLEDRK